VAQATEAQPAAWAKAPQFPTLVPSQLSNKETPKRPFGIGSLMTLLMRSSAQSPPETRHL
jgi:hypothetical protein